MQDCDEAYVCIQLMDHVKCIQRCLTNSVQKLEQNPEDLDLQKYYDVLEEVTYLRVRVTGAVDLLGNRLQGVKERLEAKKQRSSSSLQNIEIDLSKNLVIQKEESGRQEEEEKQD